MSHSRLLDLLLSQPGQYVSGEEISRKLSISRTAVWKQINKLREEGYEFDAVSRKGYRLISKPERLEYSGLLQAMNTKSFGRKLKLLEVTTSTQEEVRLLAELGAAEGTLVIAEEQTIGRGRQGRRWHSPAGKGVWMSLLLRPPLPLTRAPQLTLLSAVAVCRAIRAVTGVEVGIKWPNDLLVHGRKICGILLESIGEDEMIRYCIAGVGIDANLEPSDLPPELRTIATSLQIESGRKVDRVVLIGAVIAELEKFYELYLEEGFAPIGHLWEALSVTTGQDITVKTAQGEVRGRAMGLDENGGLLVMQEDHRLTTIFSGEVQIDGCNP
ncbi:biotin--[acetyl-CoA-carboxylase] ligase [Paenibacillus lentus]|uniref:Bifunctional ligase/repressor BirA n=1 Tax=Paenibacillus lentus TaxID=1338368 RepID=A0A3S8RWI7_9BACL|nr:biotin--[acetyl-CoA-carboxylase] ligase [Paenibacillus lentus]AZK47204.1 biotin--[acetyl-CoA-carboxylase] ligase [Paenibacillus lentus]